MSGRNRTKKGGHRPRSRTSKRWEIFIICDEDVPVRVCEALSEMPGYHGRALEDIVGKSLKDPGVHNTAKMQRAVFVTRDRRFLSTHNDVPEMQAAGFILIAMASQQPSYITPRVVRFLTKSYNQRWKSSVIELGDWVATVTIGGRMHSQIRYYSEAMERDG